MFLFLNNRIKPRLSCHVRYPTRSDMFKLSDHCKGSCPVFHVNIKLRHLDTVVSFGATFCWEILHRSVECQTLWNFDVLSTNELNIRHMMHYEIWKCGKNIDKFYLDRSPAQKWFGRFRQGAFAEA